MASMGARRMLPQRASHLTADSFGTDTFGTNDERWAAVVRRDISAAGQFYYCVSTTGVYCRVGCAARLAQRQNVGFYATCEDAERAGFRPCKRCKPNERANWQQHTAIVAKTCALIDKSEEMPNLNTLAKSAGMSRFHFHRVFKTATGITPKAYVAARRRQRIRESLAHSTTVTTAIYDGGFNSNGRFYSAASKLLGMTPSRFRAGGAGETIRFAIGECSLGSILVATTAKGVCAILLGDDPAGLIRDVQDRFRKARFIGGDENFEHWIAKVVGMVETPALGLDLPLDVRGTAFQQRVWQALLEIPCGSTASYSDIAKRIRSPKSTRAVARACAANPIAIAIPCHRVVRTDGALTGYRWGVQRKRILLDREAHS